MKHKHTLKQKNFLDSSYLECEKCKLSFEWDIMKQRYIEVTRRKK